jgi:hypothetical protein
MSIDEFMIELDEAVKNTKATCVSMYSTIRLIPMGGFRSCCPISYVCNYRSLFSYFCESEDYQEAAQRMGLSEEDANRIANSADGSIFFPEIRAQLVSITGFKGKV